MDKPIHEYWSIRLVQVKQALEANNFEVHLAEDGETARTIVLNEIVPKLKAKTMSWGGSTGFKDIGLYEALKDSGDYDIIDTYDKSISPEEVVERRRQGLIADVYFSGTNALTEDGKLVNLDMYGNRVAALAFGPKNVIVIAGRNKVVQSLEEAVFRVKNYAAPVNAMRLEKKTPCIKTSYCEECKSSDRICNVWTINEKSFPKGRIIVVLINEDLGF